MFSLLQIAWRNLWRNKRRTLITAASVFFAVWFALLMRAFQLGSYDLMVDNIVHAYSGYFQVHAKGYWGDQVLNNGFEWDPAGSSDFLTIDGMAGTAPRLESFALASYGLQTRGVMVSGVDPAAEEALTGLKRKLVAGTYLAGDDPGVMLGGRLAQYLNITVGDTLVIIGQGYHGAGAAGVFPVRGILKFPSPDLDARMVYLSLPAAQALFSAEGMVTSLACNVSEPDRFRDIAKEVGQALDTSRYEVMTWEEMMPDVVQQIESDSGSGLIMLGILYMIVGFGIFGTLLMMLNERTREFGMMIAIGMQKSRLILIVVVETFMLGLLGITTGLAASVPLIWYFHVHPIPLTGELADSTVRMGFEPLMPTAWNFSFIFAQSMVVICIILAMMFLPVMRIGKMKVWNAIRR